MFRNSSHAWYIPTAPGTSSGRVWFQSKNGPSVELAEREARLELRERGDVAAEVVLEVQADARVAQVPSRVCVVSRPDEL